MDDAELVPARPAMEALFPPEVVRRHRVIPLAVDERTVQVGSVHPLSPELLRDLAFLTGRTVVPVPVDAADVDAFIAATLPTPEVVGAPGGGEIPGDSLAGDDLLNDVLAGAGLRARPVAVGSATQEVDRLVRQAIEAQASDIHVEPYEHLFRVRYRLDGMLHTIEELSLLQRDPLVSRLKIMAGLDIAERRRPQDGRIRFRHGDRTVDLRVSTLPTDFGEKVVLRVLDRRHLRLELGALGLGPEALAVLRGAIGRPHGMVLVTGPTGSGKTTTLYAALNELNVAARNVVTVEDPIEYNLPGINQTHVRADLGFTFAQALRAFLRQDPDVVMVGEIRDAETAAIAIRAALTGHLVLSTLHTNDAPSTITRFIDLGVEPYLVASSVRLVVAQRLVRTLCVRCRVEAPLEPAHAAALGLAPGEPVGRPAGCPACRGTGYRGRAAVFEILPVDERLAERIVRRAPALELRRAAVAAGMVSLRDAALARMREGLTTPEEVLRET